jgi:hypothetical protein
MLSDNTRAAESYQKALKLKIAVHGEHSIQAAVSMNVLEMCSLSFAVLRKQIKYYKYYRLERLKDHS